MQRKYHTCHLYVTFDQRLLAYYWCEKCCLNFLMCVKIHSFKCWNLSTLTGISYGLKYMCIVTHVINMCILNSVTMYMYCHWVQLL